MIALINHNTSEKFYITKNFVITKQTTLNEYWDAVKKQFQKFWDLGSIEDTSYYSFISVEVWIVKDKTLPKSIKSFNTIQKRNYSTSIIGKPLIKRCKNAIKLLLEYLTLLINNKVNKPDKTQGIKYIK